MTEFRVSFDPMRYTSKPGITEIRSIANKIADQIKVIKPDSIKSFAMLIAEKGCTFCPATFKKSNNDFEKSRKRKENFDQIQLFALDFDSGITYQEVFDRTEQNEVPILFAYETFSSVDCNKFRVVFLNDLAITDIRAAEIMQNALMTIFPEADKGCKSVVQMYFGGKKLLYFDPSIPTINIESLIRDMTYYLKCRYGDTNYKRKIVEFAKNNSIALDKKEFLTVYKEDSLTEITGANDFNKNMPNPFIVTINGFGKNLLNYQYRITLENNGTSSSVEKSIQNKRTPYRASALNDIASRCKLYHEFITGSRLLHNDELLAIATNLVHIESGTAKFKEVLLKNSYFDDIKWKYQKWDNNLNDIRRNKPYKPQSCVTFCQYKDECSHGTNILSTIKPEFPVRLANHVEKFVPKEEIEEELLQALNSAIETKDDTIQIIKAQTAIGKSKAFIDLMANSHVRLLIAAPTNGLKHELHDRATDAGIKGIVSPSLHELDLPNDIQSKVKYFYAAGKHRSVIPYLRKLIPVEDTYCAGIIKNYLSELDKFNNSDSNAITTHKKFLYMDERQLKKYNAAIVDEDAILKAIIPDQCVISLFELERILKEEAPNNELAKKIKMALKCAKTESFFELPCIECDEEDIEGISTAIDIPSFCSAKRFYCGKASDENNLLEDNILQNSIIFYKPVDFKKNIKNIMVSATVDENICKYFFGNDRINFFECRKAEYEGVLYQYPRKSMSRACINKDLSVFERIRKITGNSDIITFKKYNKGPLYFGNTDGRDIYKGKNIDVIGTPHQPEWMYKLFAYTIGRDFNVDARIIPNMLVEHNGYKFPFTTYDDEDLRNIQFWMIESELEQAVGRARLLREKCTVNLFSNFPLRQAKLMDVDY